MSVGVYVGVFVDVVMVIIQCLIEWDNFIGCLEFFYIVVLCLCVLGYIDFVVFDEGEYVE